MDLKRVNTSGLKNGDSITVEELLQRVDNSPVSTKKSAPPPPSIILPPSEPTLSELTKEPVDPIPATAPVTSRYEMNKTETSYSWLLGGDVSVHRFWHHPFKLRLCKNQFYEVDFLVQYKDGRLEIHETKMQYDTVVKSGPLEGKVMKIRGRDDSRNKLRVVAALYPFVVKIMSKRPAKDGGGWHEEILPSDGLPLIVGMCDGSQQDERLPVPFTT